jgi:hypothetical protein
MSFFKNDKMVKKDIAVELPDRIDLKDLVKTDVQLVDVDNRSDIQKALIVEAIELFSKMLKGYPVSDKVKVWVEKAGKEL